ncbi:MAG TPA: MMPL family transporter [Thermoanaerobaculia bacterium]|nr:MMPL family transporter [Thermoanaerobaculia bacterium]
MIEQLLQRLALYARRHYRRVFVGVGLALALAVAFGTRIRFDTEILNLLPPDDPVVVAFRETLEEFGSLDVLLIAVRIPEDQVVDPYLEFADALAPRLEALEELEYVDYRIGDIEQLIEEFFPNAFLFLDAEGRRQVESRLTDEGMTEQLQKLRRRLETPQALGLRQLMVADPLGLAEVFIDRLDVSQSGLKVDWTQGYLLSRDRRMLLMVAKPTQPGQELDFARRLVAAVRGAVAETATEWPELSGDPSLPPPVVELGGTSAIAVEDAGYLTRDIVTNAVTSMLGVLVLFALAFRRLGLVIYAFVPLSCGLVLAFGFAGATVGTLNAITSGFAALLVGLGIDFVIVSYGRYVEERNSGKRLSTALRRMCGSSGRAVITGGVTTAATFYAFLVTEFSGLRQMGFLIGTGILFCMGTVLLVLPAMLAWREDHYARRRAAGATGRRAEPVLYVHGFGSERLIRACFRHPFPVLAAGALITAVTALFSLRLEFVDSIRSMRPEGNRGMQVQDEVAQRFGSGFDYMMLIVNGETEDAVVERTAVLVAEAQQLVDSGVLNNVESIAAVLPAKSLQRESIAWLARERGGLLAAERLRDTFDREARAAGLNPQPFEHGLELLAAAASVEEPIDVESLVVNRETQRLVDRYVRKIGDRWKSVVYLYPPPRVAKRDAPPEVVSMAERLGPDVQLSGINLVSARLRTQVKQDAVVAAIVGFVVVALLLWADYRRLDDTLLSLAPLVVGIVWMLGGMAMFDLHMNFFNVFVTTMIIGIGVDYGVHMMHRYRDVDIDGDGSGEALLAGMGETGKAIVLAALSTSVGFGSMAISHYPGLRSMGLVAIMGALATALVAVTLLPAFLGLRHAAVRAAARRAAVSDQTN